MDKFNMFKDLLAVLGEYDLEIRRAIFTGEKIAFEARDVYGRVYQLSFGEEK